MTSFRMLALSFKEQFRNFDDSAILEVSISETGQFSVAVVDHDYEGDLARNPPEGAQ